MTSRRDVIVFGLIALVASFFIVRLVGAPSYTDAYYHFNAASRFAAGQGLSDTYLWTYLGAPDRLPADGAFPSHLYWMPLTSLIAGVSMAIFGSPGDHAIAQLPFIPMLASVALIGFWLGGRLTGNRRGAWLAGTISLCNGFFIRYWGAVETFAPYAFFGASALAVMGVLLGRLHQHPVSWRMLLGWGGAGVLCGLAHMTRNDGLLLVGIGGLLILIVGAVRRMWRTLFAAGIALTLGYLCAMTPLFVRNMQVTGSLLPFGGTQAIWFIEYNELFNFPPDANPQRLLDFGVFETRRDAIVNNGMTFLAVEGLIVMTPFMLIGLWIKRREPLVVVFGAYALVLHVAMTLIFPFPGYRGGLLHSAAALIPGWAALGVVGLDAAVGWAAQRRRWRVQQARIVFGGALAGVALSLSIYIGVRGGVPPTTLATTPPIYPHLTTILPADARILINDPAQLYYFTGLGGAVLPNEAPSVIAEIADHYALTHVLIELDAAENPLTPTPLAGIIDSPPPFLQLLPLEDFPAVRLYAIRR